MQNKCIRFFLKLDKMHNISEKEFRLVNWLCTNKRVDQCINIITYNFVNNACPHYLNSPRFVRYVQEINFLNLQILLQDKYGTKNNFLYWSLYLDQVA